MPQKKTEAAWLDLRLPGQTVAILRQWGKRLGLSAEGCARLILLRAVMDMLPSGVDVGDGSQQEPEVEKDSDDGQASLELWRSRLESIGIDSDQLPAPRSVNGTTRIYFRDDFVWPAGAVPAWPWAHINGEDQIGVSQAPEPEGPQ